MKNFMIYFLNMFYVVCYRFENFELKIPMCMKKKDKLC
jgi:hypothetical protein